MKNYLEYYSTCIDGIVSELKTASGGELLDENAIQSIRESLFARIDRFAGSWFRFQLAELSKDQNPLLEYTPDMISPEEIRLAAPKLLEGLESGSIVIPERLAGTVQRMTDLRAGFLKQMLADLSSFRIPISDAVLDGRPYSVITSIRTAGDSHNHGSCASVITTDSGRLVYKPRSCRVDVQAYEFMDKYFGDIIRMPRVFAYEDSFGAAEYLEKKRAEGAKQAASYYYALGGTAAVIGMLGSMDMHVENLFACEDRLALIDVETLLFPVMNGEPDRKYDLYTKEDMMAVGDTVLFSGLLDRRMPFKGRALDFSILTNVRDDGSAPLVGGEMKDVSEYWDEFSAGYSDIYDRCLKRRDELREEICERFSGEKFRCIIWASYEYSGIIKRLSSRYAYSSEEYYQAQLGKLPRVLVRGKPVLSQPVLEAETEAIMEGDIPYFYTRGGSRDLCSDGRIIERDYFFLSATERADRIITRMSAEDKETELKILRLGIEEANLPCSEQRKLKRGGEIMTGQRLLEESVEILNRISERSFILPTSTRIWTSFDPGWSNRELLNAGLYTGAAGLAVFFAAMEASAVSPAACSLAGARLDDCLYLLERYIGTERLKEHINDQSWLELGEGTGIAGILKALVLTERCRRGSCQTLISDLCSLLSGLRPEAFDRTDKASGLAGLITALCRFEELYRQKKMRVLIKKLADRLLLLQNMESGTGRVWKTLDGCSHPISGAVHGMSGIAEALMLAGMRLDTGEYETAAEDALRFEDAAFSVDRGFWEDLRIPGNHKKAEGNCYGAQGIGLIANRLIGYGISNELIRRIEKRAAESIRKSDALALDHLCCGNMSSVDYYIETGDMDGAGRLLSDVVRQKGEIGAYRLGYAGCRPNHNVTMFYGLAGIGYELLRYTDSERFSSVL